MEKKYAQEGQAHFVVRNGCLVAPHHRRHDVVIVVIIFCDVFFLWCDGVMVQLMSH
jgi:hypothetical protein